MNTSDAQDLLGWSPAPNKDDTPLALTDVDKKVYKIKFLISRFSVYCSSFLFTWNAFRKNVLARRLALKDQKACIGSYLV